VPPSPHEGVLESTLATAAALTVVYPITMIHTRVQETRSWHSFIHLNEYLISIFLNLSR
jgi:hypothetical protein